MAQPDATSGAPGATARGIQASGALTACLVLALVVFVAFQPALRNGFVNYDDPDYVTQNPQVRGGLTWSGVCWAFGATTSANWHPLTWLSHMLDCQVFGLDASGHHFTSLLLHLANTLLLFGLLRRLTGAHWRSFFVAAVFGIHPLRVESVAWVSERKDLLAAFFWLLTLWSYAQYVQNANDAAHLPKSRACYLAALCFFVLGLLSKPMIVTLPFVLLLVDFWPLRRFSDFGIRILGAPKPSGEGGSDFNSRLILEKIPFLIMAAASSVVTFQVQKHGGTVQTMAGLPLISRLENVPIAYCRYLLKLCWPAGLSVFYPRPEHWPMGWVVLASFVLASVTVLAVRSRHRRPWFTVGWLWYIGTLVPVIGLVQVGEQSLADRYTYLPSIGLLVILAWGAHEFIAFKRHGAIAAAVPVFAILVCCVGLTRRQAEYWRNSETLFQHAQAVTENNYVAWWHLGDYYDAVGKPAEAMDMYRRAIQSAPTCLQAHDNLGKILLTQGRPAEAAAEFQAAVKLDPNHPRAHSNLGAALYRLGRTDEAIREFQAAVALDPDYADAHANLGNALLKKGLLDDGIVQLQTATSLNPADADSHFNLGAALESKGRVADAISQYQQTVNLQPGDAGAHNSLGAALGRQGRIDEAIREFTEAVRLDPGSAEAHCNLGTLLAARGHRDEAISHLNEALRLQPDYPQARQQLQTLMGGPKP